MVVVAAAEEVEKEKEEKMVVRGMVVTLVVGRIDDLL